MTAQLRHSSLVLKARGPSRMGSKPKARNSKAWLPTVDLREQQSRPSRAANKIIMTETHTELRLCPLKELGLEA